MSGGTARTRDDDFRYSVVLPTKDRAAVALSTVRSLAEQELKPDRVIVVDASDPPLEVPPGLEAELAASGIELVARASAPSTSGQRNLGIDLVDTPLVMFMDDDVRLPPDYARILVDRWRREGLDAYSGVVGGLDGNPIPDAPVDRLYRRLFMLHYYDPRVEGTRFRLSQKLRYNDATATETIVATTSTMAVVYRTDLARKHRFDESFDGYVLGEDHDFGYRVSRERPILLVPSTRFVHAREPGERGSPNRWYHRGRRESFFRLRRLEPTLAARTAFAASVVGEVAGAAADSLRERDGRHLRGYVRGLSETLRDVRRDGKQRLRLKPSPYYALNHAYRRARIRGAVRAGRVADTADGVRILGYHRITPERDALALHPDAFRQQLEWLLERGFRPLRVGDAVPLLGPSDPESSVDGRWFCVTFDDGYHDNLEHGLPILEDLAIPASIYVATAVVDRLATFHWYRRPPVPLTWDELRSIAGAGLVDVQAHTRTHRALPRLDDASAHDEIEGSRRDIERELGAAPTTFAYPAGIYGPRDVELVRRAGFAAALSTHPGLNVAGSPLYELRRTLVLTGDTFDDFRAKVGGALDAPSRIERFVRTRRASPAGRATHR